MSTHSSSLLFFVRSRSTHSTLPQTSDITIHEQHTHAHIHIQNSKFLFPPSIMTSRLARSTRSRSRSRVVPAEEVPAAASSNGTSANGTNGTDSLTKSSLHPNGNGVSIVSNGGSTTVPPLPPVEPTQRDEQGRSMRTNHYIEKITGSTNKVRTNAHRQTTHHHTRGEKKRERD